MSESQDENRTDVSDDRLPEDLVPGDDNPLAEPLPDGESAGDLLNEGKPADESEADEDQDTSDTSDSSQQG